MPRQRRRSILALALSCAAIASPVAAQERHEQPAAGGSAPGGSPPAFAAGVDVVALDFVVRDKKGRLISDLQPGEVEVLENGVRQTLTSFRSVGEASGGAEASAPEARATSSAAPVVSGSPPAAGTPAAAPPGRRVVLAFGRLGSDGRRLAQAAGEDFARKAAGPETVVSVVRIDGGLIPVLEGSSEPAAVRDAVKKATAAIGAGQLRAVGPSGPDTSYSGQQLSRFEGGAGVRDLSLTDSIAFVSALHGVVDSLRGERGRKSVLVFSEGFIVPPGYEHVFGELLSKANRANVSFYGMDVRGLQLTTQLGGSGAALATAAGLSEQQRTSGVGSAATREQMTQDDVVQTSVHSDAVDTLRELATSTGGFLATQTNDFGRPLARVAEDLRGYYEASYTPAAPAAPGEFRRIEVRLSRKDARVQARSGYYTSPPAPPAAVAALSVLSEAQLPHDFELLSRFYRFGRLEGKGASDCLVKVEVPLASASFRPQPDEKLSGRMVLAGRVMDANAAVVDSFGQDVALGGTREQVDSARAQVLPLARRLQLAPGDYTVELVVRDTVGDRASATRFEVSVPSPEGALELSSLIVVAAVEPADAASDPTDPLRIGDKRIVPNLGRPVAPSSDGVLPIYYSVLVEPGTKRTPSATIEVTRDGHVVARGSSPLPPADARGRIQGLSPIPLQKLTPGVYSVRVTVRDGSLAVEETTTVTVGS